MSKKIDEKQAKAMVTLLLGLKDLRHDTLDYQTIKKVWYDFGENYNIDFYINTLRKIVLFGEKASEENEIEILRIIKAMEKTSE